jgi:hypothetical protein
MNYYKFNMLSYICFCDGMRMSGTNFMWRTYILRWSFNVKNMCHFYYSSSRDKNHDVFKPFEIKKINDFVATSNELTSNFAGLVTSDLRPDVACGLPVWPHCFSLRGEAGKKYKLEVTELWGAFVCIITDYVKCNRHKPEAPKHRQVC